MECFTLFLKSQVNLKNKNIILLILTIFLLISFKAVAQDIIINEVMSSNQENIQDGDFDFNDWFELKNVSEKKINLSGYYLSDNTDKPTSWQFDPDQDFIIPPGGYLLIWADDEPDEGKLHTNFKLSSSGEELVLTEPDGISIVDQVEFPQIMTDVSFGRKATDKSEWVYFIFPTPARKNNFGISSYYWTEKIKFLTDNLILSSLFLISFLIILILMFSYYRANNKLKYSKIKYKNLFEESPIGLMRCDMKGNILEVNKEMVKLLGAPNKEEIKEFNLNNIEPIKNIWNKKFLSSKNKDIIEGEFNYNTNWGRNVFLKYKIEVILSKKNESEIIIAVNDISREKEIEKELKYLSFHDEMTGLYNRRYFEIELERLNKSRNLPISIVIGDLDNLKFINDNFGHKMGDEYIKKAAEILKNNFRDGDIIARIGGDEFAVILPDTNSETALEISKRIKNDCKNCKDYKKFGISIGHEVKNNQSEDLEEIFIKADENLYDDKEKNYIRILKPYSL
jgi:diguanylate cyclase (GGDEF)-like protein/PAS domain S-box-containing protein